MSRAHFWQYLTNTEGQPVVAANISVYNAGGEGSAVAYIFSSESGGDPINLDEDGVLTVPQLVTDSTGFFEFWVADHYEEYGYAAGSKFKIVWNKPGSIETGEINYVDIWVDKNKASIYTTDLTSASFSAVTSAGTHYVDVEHNLNEAYPVAICYDDDGTTKTSIPITFTHIDDNTTRIEKTYSTNACHIAIIG